jgi:hypothetical protein
MYHQYAPFSGGTVSDGRDRFLSLLDCALFLLQPIDLEQQVVAPPGDFVFHSPFQNVHTLFVPESNIEKKR